MQIVDKIVDIHAMSGLGFPYKLLSAEIGHRMRGSVEEVFIQPFDGEAACNPSARSSRARPISALRVM